MAQYAANQNNDATRQEALRKAYLQAMIERIVVDDQQIEIMGKRTGF